jgi:lipoic acid synthetase
LQLKYVVITSVSRDDLPDGGADSFVCTIEQIRRLSPEVKIEILIPDFKGAPGPLGCVVASRPSVLTHNLETVKRLFPALRPQGDYSRSLEILKEAKRLKGDIITKSGIMVGMGESQEEIVSTLKDLRLTGCRILTIGQYLPPSLKHHPVHKYYTPEEFQELKEIGKKMGFLHIASGPLVRSSYRATAAIS